MINFIARTCTCLMQIKISSLSVTMTFINCMPDKGICPVDNTRHPAPTWSYIWVDPREVMYDNMTVYGSSVYNLNNCSTQHNVNQTLLSCLVPVTVRLSLPLSVDKSNLSHNARLRRRFRPWRRSNLNNYQLQ